MTDFPTDDTAWIEDSGPVRNSAEEPATPTPEDVPPNAEEARGRAADADPALDDGSATGPPVVRDNEEPLVVPEFLRRAMEAQGLDPEDVIAKAAEGVIPSDEHAVFLEAAQRTGRLRCEGCKGRVDPEDPSILVEVVGWSKQRAQGGQNHVIDRAETGRVMCGECGHRLQHLGAVGYAQETLV